MKWWITRCLASQINALLLRDERILVSALANTVLGYLPGYGGPSPVFTRQGKAVVLTNRRLMLSDLSLLWLPQIRVLAPVAFPLGELSILVFRGPGFGYPFTDLTLESAGGDRVELRFTRRWDREAEAIASGFHSDSLPSI